MKRKYLLAVTCAAALWSVAALALPSNADVQSAVKAGDYPKAESMMQEVVAAKPQSARAHYVYAELLAHDRKFSEAAAEARKARELDPAIGFTDADKFRAFEQTLNREQAKPATTVPAPARMEQAPVPVRAASGGTPGWVWGLGIAAVAFLIWRMVSRRAAMAGPAAAGGYGMQPGSPQPGYGPGYGGGYAPGYGQAPGGGLLRTGLAAAGGVAAGMMLEKMLDDNHRDTFSNQGAQGGLPDNGSSSAADDLENRPIDFGSGNDWDSGGGGGDNFSPSGGGDDGGW